VLEGKDVIPIPTAYLSDFRSDPLSALLRYGSLAQRARAPWFTDTRGLDECLVLPDMVCGPSAEKASGIIDYRALVGSRNEFTMLEGISPHFRGKDGSYWHVHVDLALNKKRHGDAAGIAMGRIVESSVERSDDARMRGYERVVNRYEIPLVAQIIAPHGDQIYLSSVIRFILQLRQVLGFNVTSFSTDTFQSASVGQELTQAGLVTAGMEIDEESGAITGLPKPFSVDGHAVAPYRELLESVNERRCQMPNYPILKQELRRLECLDPGFAPDHPIDGSKDTADPCAGVVGYLAMFGHAVLKSPETLYANIDTLREQWGMPETPEFAIEDKPLDFAVDGEAEELVRFGVE
jgi:hypothetical protein